jgi:hypothetical protein
MMLSRRLAAHLAVLLAVSCGGQSNTTEPGDAPDAMADQRAADVQLVDSGWADAAQEPLITCPVTPPFTGQACAGVLSCTYVDRCVCGVCCQRQLVCNNGMVALGGYNDGCFQVSQTCDAGLESGDAHAASDASTASDATDASMASDAIGVSDGSDASDSNAPSDAAPICTPGQDQTCNENPISAALHGHCTDERTCVCKNDAAPNTSSGRCP